MEEVERLAEWYKFGKGRPLRIDIEPTATCNLKCKFCWTRDERRIEVCRYEKLLDEKTILRVIKEAWKLGVKEWQIAGGWEPLVKPKLLMKMVELIKKLGMRGCITTNGTLFSEKMIKRMVEIGWDHILFSVEGPNSKIHDELVGKKGAFKRVKKNLLLFKKWKEKLGKEKPTYSIHAVLCNKNFREIPQLIKFGKEVGCCGVNFEPLIVWGKDCEEIKIKKEEFGELKNQIKKGLKIARKLNLPTNLQWWLDEALVEKKDMRKILKKLSKGKGFLNSPCYYPFLGMEIRVSGRVTPCRLCDDDLVCDSVFEKSLEEIWYDGYLKEFRENLLEWKLSNFCKRCASGVVVETLKLRKKLIEFLKRKK